MTRRTVERHRTITSGNSSEMTGVKLQNNQPSTGPAAIKPRDLLPLQPNSSNISPLTHMSKASGMAKISNYSSATNAPNIFPITIRTASPSLSLSSSNNTAPTASTQNSSTAATLNRSVPGFVSKLYRMVNEGSTLIRWSPSGTSFLVIRPEEFSRVVLPRYFKHNNFSSFVRQLNMYGFHKVPQVGTTSEEGIWEFVHDSFIRGRPDLLLQVRRKVGVKDEDNHSIVLSDGGSALNNQNVNIILQELASLRMQQVALRSDLSSLQRDSQVLWNEVLASRDRHQQQQEIIDKILRFLASVFSSEKLSSGTTNLSGNSLAAALGSGVSLTPRKRPLMIEELPANSSSMPSPTTTRLLDMPVDLFYPITLQNGEICVNDSKIEPPGHQERIYEALKTADAMQDDINFLVDNLDPALLHGQPAANNNTATIDPIDLDWERYANFYPSSQPDHN